MITGYPAVRNRIKERNPSLPALATHLITGDIRPIEGLGLVDKFDSHHFALFLDTKRIRTHGGDPFRVPEPHGMSGGGVWRLDIDVQTKIATTPLLVGIGIEYHKSKKVFVSTRIQSAIPLAHDLLSLLSGVTPTDVIQLISQP
jgi:hypothetical protein